MKPEQHQVSERARAKGGPVTNGLRSWADLAKTGLVENHADRVCADERQRG